MVPIGRLNRRVTIQRPIATKDAFGQESIGWDDVITVWGSVRPVRVKEQTAGGQDTVMADYTVAIRATDAVAPLRAAVGLRIQTVTPYGTQTLDVRGVRDSMDARRFMIFDCIEGPQDGR